MKQKMVIKVEMTCDRCRSKALALVAATRGVDSVALAGGDRDQVVVVGDGVDSIKLACALRRKVGPAQIVQLDEDKKPAAPAPAPAPAPAAAVPQYAPVASPWYYQCPPPQPPVSFVYEPPAAGYAYGYQTRPDTICSIM